MGTNQISEVRERLLLLALKEVSTMLNQFVTLGESLGVDCYNEERDAISNAEFLITSIEADEAIIEFKQA